MEVSTPSTADHAWATANKVAAALQRLESRMADVEEKVSNNKVSVDGQDLLALINFARKVPVSDKLSYLNIENIQVVCDRLQASMWRPGAKG